MARKFLANLCRDISKLIESSQFAQRHRASPKSFVRRRPGGLPLATVVRILLNLCKNSLQDELDGYPAGSDQRRCSKILDKQATEAPYSTLNRHF